MSADTLTIIDNRTGKRYDLPIEQGAIRAIDLRQIRTGAGDFGLMTYDPAFQNTASCRSRVTYIDGDQGVLLHRGYPIEQLAEHSTFLETAYLLLFGELPTAAQLGVWQHDITFHTMLHESVKQFMEGFQYDAHPMGILLSAVGCLSTIYPDAKRVTSEESRGLQIRRLIAKVPTIAAWAYRHRIGRPYDYPDNHLSFTGNFLHMLFRTTDLPYQPHPVLERALDVLFILHADHEQNCSTNAMRGIGSAQTDPYSALAGAIAALSGPLHGGANEAVLRMLTEIGTVSRVPDFVARVKKGEGRLMGFGHRVYKLYDPRARIIKRTADEVFAVTGRNPLLDIALELERIALEDDYFVSRKLYPNVDFYSGLIYQAMGFPVDMFPVLFAIPRTAGWLAQWDEMLRDPDQKIARPRQIYTGAPPVRTSQWTDGPDRRPRPATRPQGVPMPRTLMTTILCTALLGCQTSTAATPDQSGAQTRPAAAAFDSNKAWEHLRQMVMIGPRPSGSEALRQTRAYITRQIASAGLTVEEQPFVAQTPNGPVNMVNLVVRLPGRRTDRVLITGHYDTKIFRSSCSSARATARRARPC